MKRRTRILLLLLAALVALPLLAACGEEGSTPEVTTASNEQSGDPNVNQNLDANGYLKDSLPESYNFDSDFNIFTWQEEASWEWCMEVDAKSTALEQVLYRRQKKVEERFGVTISTTEVLGNYDFRTSFIDTLANSVLVGDAKYDLVSQYTLCAGIGTVNGLYQDLMGAKFLDLSKPWWPSKISSTATVGERLYFVTGDISPTLIRNVNCATVNLDLWESYNLSSLVGNRTIYEVVDDHDWTLETMLMLGLDKVSITGDPNTQVYGITMRNNVCGDAFLYGGGFVTVINEQGSVSLNPELGGQKIIDYFEKVQKLMSGSYEDAAITGATAFTNSKSIFYIGGVADSPQFAQQGLKFSLLPMPLMNKEDRQDYTGVASMNVSMFGVPVDVKNTDMSTLILEALGSEAYRLVSDEVYYSLFQQRYNGTDENSARMFDLVSDSVVFDTVRFFNDDLGFMASFRKGVADVNGNWKNIYDGEHVKWADKLATLAGKIG